MSKIACIGHSTVDVYMDVPAAHLHDFHSEQKEMCLLWGAKYEAEDLHISVGGNAHNVAQGLKKFNHDVALFTAFGTDVFGDYARKFIAQAGLNTHYIHEVSRTNVSTIMNVKADRTLLAFHSHEKFEVSRQEIEDFAPDWIFITSFAYSTYSDVHEMIHAYKKNNSTVKLLYNPGGKELKDSEMYKETIPLVDILIVNFDEAKVIAAGFGHRESSTIQEVMDSLQKHILGTIVITDGGNGAYVCDDENVYHQRPFPTTLVEKTGAGDAFTSGFLAGILEGVSATDALRWGAAQSAAALQVPGSSEGLLDENALRQILATLQEYKPEKI